MIAGVKNDVFNYIKAQAKKRYGQHYTSTDDIDCPSRRNSHHRGTLRPHIEGYLWRNPHLSYICRVNRKEVLRRKCNIINLVLYMNAPLIYIAAATKLLKTFVKNT